VIAAFSSRSRGVSCSGLRTNPVARCPQCACALVPVRCQRGHLPGLPGAHTASRGNPGTFLKPEMDSFTVARFPGPSAPVPCTAAPDMRMHTGGRGLVFSLQGKPSGLGPTWGKPPPRFINHLNLSVRLFPPCSFQSVWATTSLSHPRSQVRTFCAVCRAARPTMVARAPSGAMQGSFLSAVEFTIANALWFKIGH